MKTLWLGIAAALVFAGSIRAEVPAQIPLETLFSDPDMQTVKISPNGRYLTWMAPRNQRINLAILDRKTNKLSWLTNMKEESVVYYVWAKEDRILFAQQFGGREQFGMFACDPDGKNLVVINKLERVESTPDGAGEGDTPGSERDLPKALISLLPKDPDHILMTRTRGNSGLSDVIKVNIRNGKETVEERNYINARVWIPDRDGFLRLAICTDFDEPIRIKYRANEKAEWKTLAEFGKEVSLIGDEASPVEPHWRPCVFAKDNHTLYVKSFIGYDTSAILTLDADTGVWGPVLFNHARVEPGDRLANYRLRVGGLGSRAATEGLIFNHKGDLAGIGYDDDYPEVKWLDPEMAAIMHDLNSALPDTHNSLVSGTSDGSLYVVRAASDRDPGTFYLYTPASHELAQLGRARNNIDPAKMAEMRPVHFKARDGWDISGYLTIPAGRLAKKLPMILVPHGGPFGPRDTWGYNDQIQYLANRGYAVLQVNYRGSGGYGLKFQLGGYREWGRKMQDDLSDGVKWCIDQGLVDPARVGIFGASYGGYAVMAGLTFTPELYCCGVNYVGVADLEVRSGSRGFTPPRVFREYGEIRDLHPVKDAALMHEVSPINYIKNIQAPLFAAYGKNDPRVTFDQQQLLVSRLKEYGKTYEMLTEDNEGHGFRKLENKLEFYRRVDAFLTKYMAPAGTDVKIGTPEVVTNPGKKS